MALHKDLNRGFALIILAVLLAILGLVLISRVPAQPDKDKVVFIRTQTKLDAIHAALLNYYNLNSGTLPCPANPTLNTKIDAAFGTAVATGAACSTTASCPAGLVCAAADPNAAGNSTANQIKIGGVPTKTLGLPDEYAFDEWGNRLTFAVDPTAAENIGVYYIDRTGASPATVQYSNTANPCYTSASAATPNSAIAPKNSRCLTDDVLNPITIPAGQLLTYGTHKGVAAFIVAHGKDGSAIWNRNGTSAGTCANYKNPSGTALITTATSGLAIPSEVENCNNDASFIMDTEGETKDSASGKSSYYDDLTTYFVPGKTCNNPIFAMMILSGSAVSKAEKDYSVGKLCDDGTYMSAEQLAASDSGNLWIATNGSTAGSIMNGSYCLELANGNPLCVVTGGINTDDKISFPMFWAILPPDTKTFTASGSTNYTGANCLLAPQPAPPGAGVSYIRRYKSTKCVELNTFSNVVMCALGSNGTNSGFGHIFEVDTNNTTCPIIQTPSYYISGSMTSTYPSVYSDILACAPFVSTSDMVCIRQWAGGSKIAAYRLPSVYDHDAHAGGAPSGSTTTLNPYLPVGTNTTAYYIGKNEDGGQADCKTLSTDEVLCVVAYEDMYYAGAGPTYYWRPRLDVLVFDKDITTTSLADTTTLCTTTSGSSSCTSPVATNPIRTSTSGTDLPSPNPNNNWNSYSPVSGTYVPPNIGGMYGLTFHSTDNPQEYATGVFCNPYTTLVGGVLTPTPGKFTCVVTFYGTTGSPNDGVDAGVFIVTAGSRSLNVAPTITAAPAPTCSSAGGYYGDYQTCSKTFSNNNKFFCLQQNGGTTWLTGHQYRTISFPADGNGSCSIGKWNDIPFYNSITNPSEVLTQTTFIRK